MVNIPAAEWPSSVSIVRGLLRHQAPELADAPVRHFGHGWDNELFAVGDDLLARLPRRALALPLVLHEQRWLPVLAPTLDVPIPAPVLYGAPGPGFPHPWSLVPRLPGHAGAEVPVADGRHVAAALAQFLVCLHRPAPAHAPVNPFRGHALTDSRMRARVAERLDALGAPGAGLRSRWDAATSAPVWPGPASWLHGDLHPLNVLVENGQLSGVIDWGDISSGDPACDLAVAWLLFDASGRAAFQAFADAHGSYDPAIWTRAAGWALHFALLFRTSADDQPLLAAAGRHALAELGAEFR